MKPANNIKNFKGTKPATGVQQTAYIAGKVTGLPYLEVLKNFNNAHQRLESYGYKVLNPIQLVAQNTDWQQAMRICLSVLPHADVIYLLDNWEQSPGAVWEKETAERLGITELKLCML